MERSARALPLDPAHGANSKISRHKGISQEIPFLLGPKALKNPFLRLWAWEGFFFPYLLWGEKRGISGAHAISAAESALLCANTVSAIRACPCALG